MAKDGVLNIKNFSHGSMMGAHLVSPQMTGIMPRNIGGCDVGKASKVFFRNDLVPLQERMKEINE
ncbi:TPA: hypothetical protein MIM79_04600 [Klebsiella variicola]|nr:hypothetical protein [Klebsiella variicola]